MAKAKAKAPVESPIATTAAVQEPPVKRKTAPIVESKTTKINDENLDTFFVGLTESEPASFTDDAAPEAAAAAGTDTPSETSSSEVSPPPAAPAVIKHNRRLLNEALEWGFPQTFIDATPSEELDGLLYERQRSARIEAQKQAQVKAQPKPEAKPVAEPESPFSEKDYEGWGDGVAETLKKRDASILAALKVTEELKRELAELKGHFQQREVRSVQQRLQAWADKHATVFTKDAAGTAKMRAVMSHLQSIGETRENADQLESDLDEGLKLLGFASPPTASTSPPPTPASPAPDEPTPEQKALTARQQEFKEGGVAKPSARTAVEEPHGEVRATKYLKEKLGARAAGAMDSAEKKQILDDFFGTK